MAMNSKIQKNKDSLISIFSKSLDLKESEIEKMMFYSSDSFRLSKFGFEIMKGRYHHFPYDHNHKFITNHLLSIARLFEYPYYLTTKRLVIFSRRDKVTIELKGGIDKFLESLSKRLP